jgi:hypothetical protein
MLARNSRHGMVLVLTSASPHACPQNHAVRKRGERRQKLIPDARRVSKARQSRLKRGRAKPIVEMQSLREERVLDGTN